MHFCNCIFLKCHFKSAYFTSKQTNVTFYTHLLSSFNYFNRWVPLFSVPLCHKVCLFFSGDGNKTNFLIYLCDPSVCKQFWFILSTMNLFINCSQQVFFFLTFNMIHSPSLPWLQLLFFLGFYVFIYFLNVKAIIC